MIKDQAHLINIIAFPPGPQTYIAVPLFPVFVRVAPSLEKTGPKDADVTERVVEKLRLDSHVRIYV
jgi:hypothetical protein